MRQWLKKHRREKSWKFWFFLIVALHLSFALIALIVQWLI